MFTTNWKIGSYARLTVLTALSLGFLLSDPSHAYAERRGNSPGPKGGVGTGAHWKNTNSPGQVGGPGAGPRWKDNPPGPYGGKGTDGRGFRKGEIRDHLKKRADKNHDGVVDKKERERLKEILKEKLGKDQESAEGGEEESVEEGMTESGESYEEVASGNFRVHAAQKLLDQLLAQRERLDQRIARLESRVNEPQTQTA